MPKNKLKTLDKLYRLSYNKDVASEQKRVACHLVQQCWKETTMGRMTGPNGGVLSFAKSAKLLTQAHLEGKSLRVYSKMNDQNVAPYGVTDFSVRNGVVTMHDDRVNGKSTWSADIENYVSVKETMKAVISDWQFDATAEDNRRDVEWEGTVTANEFWW